MKAIICSPDGAEFGLIADSAIGRDAMPLFIDANAGAEWSLCVAAALRIGRLGKNVAPKFALRYIDAYAPVALLLADGKPVRGFMDSALTAGSWTMVDASRGLPSTMRLEAKMGGSERTVDVCDADKAAVSALVAVTTLATIKTGDIIIPQALEHIIVPAVAPSLLQASLGATEPQLRLKIR